MDLIKLSAIEIAAAIEAGDTTCEAVTRALLDRIEEREPEVEAWEYLDPDRALAAAKVLDNSPSKGLIHGVPIGVKDIIDTRDMPTTHGSPIHKDNRPGTDAPCVSLIRGAGGLVMGKTVTSEFAAQRAGKTKNPHNPAHSPAGSSSGSAAAVTDFMIPVQAARGNEEGDSYVWSVDPDTMEVHRSPVTLGAVAGSMVRVLGGLEDGDEIATSGVGELREGMRVRRFGS